MREYFEIGSSPPEEDCAQLGTPGYHERARAECQRYIEAIRKKLGKEPFGARLCIKSFPHDFGEYLEVVCWFDESLVESVNYAFRCESDGPATWDDVQPVEVVKEG